MKWFVQNWKSSHVVLSNSNREFLNLCDKCFHANSIGFCPCTALNGITNNPIGVLRKEIRFGLKILLRCTNPESEKNLFLSEYIAIPLKSYRFLVGLDKIANQKKIFVCNFIKILQFFHFRKIVKWNSLNCRISPIPSDYPFVNAFVFFLPSIRSYPPFLYFTKFKKSFLIQSFLIFRETLLYILLPPSLQSKSIPFWRGKRRKIKKIYN